MAGRISVVMAVVILVVVLLIILGIFIFYARVKDKTEEPSPQKTDTAQDVSDRVKLIEQGTIKPLVVLSHLNPNKVSGILLRWNKTRMESLLETKTLEWGFTELGILVRNKDGSLQIIVPHNWTIYYDEKIEAVSGNEGEVEQILRYMSNKTGFLDTSFCQPSRVIGLKAGKAADGNWYEVEEIRLGKWGVITKGYLQFQDRDDQIALRSPMLERELLLDKEQIKMIKFGKHINHKVKPLEVLVWLWTASRLNQK